MQDVVTISNFSGPILALATETTPNVAVVGQCRLYGGIFSSQAAILNVDYCFNDQSGPPLIFPYTRPFPIAAGTAITIEMILAAKVARLRIVCGAIATTIECYFAARPNA